MILLKMLTQYLCNMQPMTTKTKLQVTLSCGYCDVTHRQTNTTAWSLDYRSSAYSYDQWNVKPPLEKSRTASPNTLVANPLPSLESPFVLLPNLRNINSTPY